MRTRGGIAVFADTEPCAADIAFADVATRLDREAGLLRESMADRDGWYRTRRLAVLDPVLSIEAVGCFVHVRTRRSDGAVVAGRIAEAVTRDLGIATRCDGEDRLIGPLAAFGSGGATLFDCLRVVLDVLHTDDVPCLGLYGIAGHGLAWHAGLTDGNADIAQRHLVLFLPGEVLRDDGRSCQRFTFRFDPDPLVRHVPAPPHKAARPDLPAARQGATLEAIRRAVGATANGDVGTLVYSKSIRHETGLAPSVIYRRLVGASPAPYAGLISLGDEHVIMNSPLQLVRLDGGVVEAAVICGTAKRGPDPVTESLAVRTLLNSTVDEAAHNACSDHVYQDMLRSCAPGSIERVGRRDIERHASVIHMVDRFRGRLRETAGPIDLLRRHWAPATVTGAPRRAALRLIGALEATPRGWYGGAVVELGANGTLDAGVIIRGLVLRDGTATLRVGGSLVATSIPEHEVSELTLKAKAALAAVEDIPKNSPALAPASRLPAVVVIETGDSLTDLHLDLLNEMGVDHRVVKPDEFQVAPGEIIIVTADSSVPGDLIGRLLARKLAACLIGHAGHPLVRRAGGSLVAVTRPGYGGADELRFVMPSHPLAQGLPVDAIVGRYDTREVAAGISGIRVIAENGRGVPLIFEALDAPLLALQFRPEAIASRQGDFGKLILGRSLRYLAGLRFQPA